MKIKLENILGIVTCSFNHPSTKPILLWGVFLAQAIILINNWFCAIFVFEVQGFLYNFRKGTSFLLTLWILPSVVLPIMSKSSNSQSSSDMPDSTSQRKRRCANMREWLEDLLDQNTCPGLEWKDRSQRIFTIVWKHASSQGFDQYDHARIFYLYAEFKGKLGEIWLLKIIIYLCLNKRQQH